MKLDMVRTPYKREVGPLRPEGPLSALKGRDQLEQLEHTHRVCVP